MLSLFLAVLRWILSLRYDITVKDIEVFDTMDPVLVLPNHPALVDPMMLVSLVAKKKILSPLMTETYFHTPGLGPIVRALRTIPVGDLAKGGTIEDVNSAFIGIDTALKNKQNILIYPSGHIYVQPFEHIVGKKMAFEVVSRLPEGTKIILTRTKGLWGSMWGKAYTGDSPKLTKVLLLSLWHILANGIFFSPKRAVSVEFEDMTRELKEWHILGIDRFNQKLQDYYNEGGNEACRYIPHYFYHDDTQGKKEPKMIAGSIAELQSTFSLAEEEVPDEIKKSLYETVARIKKIPPHTLRFSSNLVLDLHCDSLDMAEIKASLQNMYPKSSNPPISTLKTVGDLSAMVLGTLVGETVLPESHFPKASREHIEFRYSEGDTILSRALSNFRSHKHTPFLYDSILGELTRDDFLLKSYVIGSYLKKYKSEHIGIMMPALSSTSLLIFGSYLAAKLPVLLNWTVGERSFSHCMDFAGLDTILTSRKFYEKIQSPWLAAYESKMVFIEDIVRDISWYTKIIAFMSKTVYLTPKIGEYAVMLFTSGSESLPKAVVLTHKNILSDIAGALSLVPFQKHETLIGFLPPFHSFGFTINTIFPLVAPVQAAYTPDPGDARTIGKIISHTQASIISATPTFLRMIISGNNSPILSSLAYAFVGAEKCSPEVFHLFSEKCPDATILEGYGITECSPIVTVNPLDSQKRGSAGKFLPTVQSMIRSLDTMRVMPSGEQGMIYVSGPSIFSGYRDPSIESPFVDYDGEKWYKTGDLGYIDKDGFLYITGRLKRFIKIAGEMISLPYIEEILLEKYGHPEFPTLAIEAKEEENGGVVIVVFTIFESSVDELNDYIHTHGASNLVKFVRLERLEAIPVLGTGKIDYKALKSKI